MNVSLKNISFAYPDGEQVFDSHSMTLHVPDASPNKLYGIIGPSGTGKTTLISILGGQLNPQGDVVIDGVNIYQTYDNVRRGLIGMQLQTATSLRGKLKYNMLFGLPRPRQESEFDFISKAEPSEFEVEEDIYSDDELIDTLKRVGLWPIFESKKGLDTLIGEGGVNLSGGQRQRLNFAGLYLRAKHYKPIILLIDEPTSSLDEISEQAITQMIQELAEDAITFVVAHRLKTLELAAGLLDASLIETNKELTFMTRDQLQTSSQYYRDLLVGKATLED